MKYGLLFVGLFLGVSTLAFAKSKNKQPPADTAATTATAPIPGVPAPVSKFLNQQDLDKMTKKGLKLNVGTTPPNMEGTYILDSQTVRHKSGDFPGDYPIGHVVDLYTYTLKHKGITVDVEYASPAVDDKGTADKAFVSGSGNCFTLYMDKKGEQGGCHYKVPSVVSACVDEAGLKNFRASFTMKSKSGSPVCDELMPLGYVRIYEEADGLAKRKQLGDDSGSYDVEPSDEPAPEKE